MIFVSHAANDKSVVDDFFILLQTGAGVVVEEAFISSTPGTGVPAGEHFVERVKSSLGETKLFIPFITPNYYASRFCIAELGAAWIKDMNIFPLVAPGMDREIGSNMLGTHTERIDRPGLNKLFDRIKEVMPARTWDTERWELMRDQFLNSFEEKYPDLPDPAVVDRSKLEAEQKRAESAMKLQAEFQAKLSDAEKQIEALKKAKDADEVREIQIAHSGEREVYSDLLNSVAKEFVPHSQVILRALYASFTNSDWSPDSNTWRWWSEDFERGIGGERLLTDDRDNPRFLSANTDHPQIRKAWNAVHSLDQFIKSKASPDLLEALEDEYELPVSMTNREYWEEVILKGQSLPE